MKLSDVLKYAKENGYEDVEAAGKWNGYEVYYPIYSEVVAYVGLPYAILVKGNEIRMTDEKESFEVMRSRPEYNEVE